MIAAHLALAQGLHPRRDTSKRPLLSASTAWTRGISMKKWQCIVCGLIYNEADGWPEDGIAPGTLWQDVPEDWLCPDCGVGKTDFEMIEIG
jgi:rubredoxin